MAIELLAKPVVDALLKAFDRAKDARLRANARKAIGEAISELIRISPDLSKAQAKIAIARAAGILDQDLFTAERMLKKVKKAVRKAARPGFAKKPAGKLRKRKPAGNRWRRVFSNVHKGARRSIEARAVSAHTQRTRHANENVARVAVGDV